MRKSFLIVFFLVSGLSLQAQSPYRHSIGGVGCTMWGVSYKTFLSDHVALSLDFGNQFVQTGGEDWPQVDVFSIELNPNLMEKDQPLSRLWANGYLGGVPNL